MLLCKEWIKTNEMNEIAKNSFWVVSKQIHNNMDIKLYNETNIIKKFYLTKS